MKEVIEHLERMAKTLDGVTEENWLDTPEDIAQIYRSVANEIKQKMSAQNQSVTNCNQLQPNKVENAENNHIRLNMAKDRDALRKVISLYKSWANKALSSSKEETNDYLMSACHVAMDALSAPPRNCDVYTMAEQSKRHEEYCKSHSTNGRCVKCPLWQMRLLGINCAIAWANLPSDALEDNKEIANEES